MTIKELQEKLEDLKTKALKMARENGHKPYQFEQDIVEFTAITSCYECGGLLRVQLRGMEDEGKIDGSLLVSCEGKRLKDSSK